MSEYTFLRNVKRVEVVAARLAENLLSGNYRSVFPGQGMEFDEVRQYEEHDDVRRIDWNVTARMGAPHTKVFREEREVTLFFIVDVSASLRTGSGVMGKHELACWVLAILALSAEMNNDVAGALYFSDELEKWTPPQKGRKHILRLINDLITLEPRGRGSDIALGISKAASTLKHRGICILISDFKSDGYLRDLGVLSKRHDCIAVKVYDPADFELPRVGIMPLVDPETRRVVMADTNSTAFRTRYREFWEHRHMQWAGQCRRRGAETIEISTSDDPGVKLHEFFLRRRRRR